MAEDWRSIAGEVSDALRSVGDVSGDRPLIIREIRRPGVRPSPGTPAVPVEIDHVFLGIEDYQQLKDANGTLIDETRHTVIVEAVNGVTPTEDMRLSFDDGVTWVNIIAVRPFAPVGIAVLYEIDLAR